jgi:benzil reductase ((S)-benzoin forming)
MNRATTNAAENVVWISGATSGLGEALAANVPFIDTRIVSLSRRAHPTCESMTLELTDPSTWNEVGAHFTDVLAQFRGKRAIFIHNAYFHVDPAFVGEGDASAHEREAIANVIGPLILGDLFIRAARPAVEAGVDVGLVQISSASARVPYEGLAIYGASKAAMEQWVRAVRMERARRGRGPWVVAVRPGFVDTPSARRSATYSPDDYPTAPFAAEALAQGNALSQDDAARAIWAALPPGPDEWLLLFGDLVRPGRDPG